MKELGWPTLANRRKGNKLKQFLKIINNQAPSYLESLVPEKIGVNRPQSRNAENYHIVRARTETYKNSFIPSAVSLFNSLDTRNRSFEHCNDLMRQDKFPLFYHGKRSNNIKHAQLRMECSKLNHHLFSNHVLDSPECSCGSECEDVEHYLLHCPLYFEERATMLTEINNICVINVSWQLLLYGTEIFDFCTNCKLFDIVHKFIEVTDRL